jgi:lipopolysaccharide transport system permease protein
MFYKPPHLMAVFLTKLRFNLKAEANKTYLNYLWWILEPALHVAVFYLVFSVFLNRGSDDFLLFLLCGKIPFCGFQKP